MNVQAKSVTVLIVEDDALVRLFAVDVVTEEGFTVFEAADAADAIQMLELHPEIQIVFTDVEMPGTMDGVKLAHYVRHRWPPIQLIVVSGRVDLAEQYLLPVGAVIFSKPYTGGYVADRFREAATRLALPN